MPIFLATLCLGIAFFINVFAAQSYAGAISRSNERAPVTRVDSPDRPIIGYVEEHFDSDPLTVLALQPKPGVQEIHPPGLPEWPLPGQAWLARDLLAKYPVGGDSPWGKVAGEITRAGLSTLDEQLVYYNPAKVDLAAQHSGPITEVVGFGSGHAVAWQLGSPNYNESFVSFQAMLTMFVILPAMLAVWSASGVNVQKRRIAVVTYTAMGASRRFRIALIAGEFIAPVSAAFAALIGIALSLIWADVNVPVVNFTVQRADLVASLPYLAMSAFVACVVAVICGVCRCGLNARVHGANLQSTRDRPEWFAWLAPASLICVALGVWRDVPQPLDSVVFAFLMLLFLTSISVLVQRGVSACYRQIARRATSPSILVAARQAESNSRRHVAMGMALTIIIGTFGVTQLYTSFYGAEVAAAREVAKQAGNSVLEVQFSYASNRPALLEIAAAQSNVAPLGMVMAGGPMSDGPTVMVGTCAALQYAGLTCDGKPHVALVSTLLNPALRYVITTNTYRVETVNDSEFTERIGGFTNLYLASKAGSEPQIDVVKKVAIQYQALVRPVAADWSGNLNNQHVKWLTVFAPFAMMTLALALALNAWGSLIERSEAAIVLSLLWRDPKLVWGISAFNVALPMVIGTITGLVSYLYLARVFTSMYVGMEVSVPTFVALGFTSLATIFAFWIVSTLRLNSSITRNPLEALK